MLCGVVLWIRWVRESGWLGFYLFSSCLYKLCMSVCQHVFCFCFCFCFCILLNCLPTYLTYSSMTATVRYVQYRRCQDPPSVYVRHDRQVRYMYCSYCRYSTVDELLDRELLLGTSPLHTSYIHPKHQVHTYYMHTLAWCSDLYGYTKVHG